MRKKKSDKDEELILCRDCVHSYDYHELDYKHEPFLCKCPFFKWSRFLKKDTCEKAVRKQT